MTQKIKSQLNAGRRNAIKRTAALTAAAATAQFGFPAILRAQSDVIALGHLTPRTGFLAQLGEYAFRGASLRIALRGA